MSVDYLITRLHRTIRPNEHFQFIGNITSPELTDILCVYCIGKTKLLSHPHM